ncbi:hypothetical protein GOODEAATRI_003015 [Goodea atripinnis]|uniref:Uncharacterized protein n=1 Tax=Goodea atripinnis TaxID=208336 RepID=A0ABV0PKD6_9TELE
MEIKGPLCHASNDSVLLQSRGGSGLKQESKMVEVMVEKCGAYSPGLDKYGKIKLYSIIHSLALTIDFPSSRPLICLSLHPFIVHQCLSIIHHSNILCATPFVNCPSTIYTAICPPLFPPS